MKIDKYKIIFFVFCIIVIILALFSCNTKKQEVINLPEQELIITVDVNGQGTSTLIRNK